jgi:hypothetical protein
VLLDSNLLLPPFAKDAAGELLVLSFLAGAAYRIVEADD